MNKKLLILSLSIVALIHAKSEIELFIQPLYSLQQNGDFTDSSTSEFSLHRAKVKTKFEKDIDKIELFASVSLDFAEKEYSDILKNAYAGMEIRPWLKWKMGQFKSNFGYESALSSKKLPLINRGEISSYLRKKTDGAGYLQGIELYGSVKKKFSYSASLFNNSGIASEGDGAKVNTTRTFAMPVLSLEYKPNDLLQFYSSFIIPHYGILDSNQNSGGQRYFMADYAVTIDTRIYSGAFEYFQGEDTADTREYLQYTSNKNVGITNGFVWINSFKIPHTEKMWTGISSRFEYINGLEYDGISFKDRDFNYTLTGGLRFNYTKNYFIDLNIQDIFNSEFNSMNHLELSLQISALFTRKQGSKE